MYMALDEMIAQAAEYRELLARRTQLLNDTAKVKERLGLLRALLAIDGMDVQTADVPSFREV